MNAKIRILPPSAFDLVIMVLSIISVVIIVLHQFGPFDAAEKDLLLKLDTGICVVLLSHFFMAFLLPVAKNSF